MDVDYFDVQVVEAAEEDGKGEGRMLSTLSRFLWRISTMEHQRSYHYLAMSCAQSARGEYAMWLFIIGIIYCCFVKFPAEMVLYLSFQSGV